MSLSLRGRVLAALLPRMVPSVTMPVEEQRRRADRGMGAGRGVFVDEVRLGSIPATRVRPRTGYPEHHLLHLHGGGFVVGTSRSFASMLAVLARDTSSIVTSVDYRLAPEHPYPAAIDDALAAYRALLTETTADHVTVIGESAGGNAVLALLIRARDEGLPMPAAAVVFSPWTDLTMSGESMTSNRDTEVFLDPELLRSWRDAYVGTADPADPGISPLFADLAGLPPLHVQACAGEVLRDDSVRLVGAARDAGVETELHLFDDLWHVFQVMAPMLPEASTALRAASAFIRSHR